MEDMLRARRAQQVVDDIVGFFYFTEEGKVELDQEVNGGDLVDFVGQTLEAYGFRPGEEIEPKELPDGPQFILTLPDGLKDYIKSYSNQQLRRRLSVFINGKLGLPGTHYILQDDREAICLLLQRTELEDLVICDPRLDEKWYWQPHSWGRL